MPENSDLLSLLAFLCVFAVTSALGYALFLWLHRDNRRALARLRDLSSSENVVVDTGSKNSTSWMLPQLGTLMLSAGEDRHTDLKTHLLRAGYGRNSLRFFMGCKLLLMIVFPALFAIGPYVAGFFTLRVALVVSVVASAAGIFAPNVWLRHYIEHRQRILRRGIPDALDMLVLCLEGGVSLVGAIQRVAVELQMVHPLMGAEMRALERSIQLGLSAGEAFREFAQRTGLQDVRDLASVILQSERYGASLVKTLQTHADWFRMERQQRAEERAQQAAVKILFPTLLCIFPAIFVVLLGPAMFQIAAMFSQ